MAERFPVVRLTFGNGIATLIGGDQLEIRDGKVYAVRGILARIPEPIDCTVEVSNNIPRAQANEAVTCGECRNWNLTEKWEFDEERDRTGIVARKRCTCEDGLRNPKRDGSSSCSYAEPRKAREDAEK